MLCRRYTDAERMCDSRVVVHSKCVWPETSVLECVCGQAERQGGVLLFLCSSGLREGKRGSGEWRKGERSATPTQ